MKNTSHTLPTLPYKKNIEFVNWRSWLLAKKLSNRTVSKNIDVIKFKKRPNWNSFCLRMNFGWYSGSKFNLVWQAGAKLGPSLGVTTFNRNPCLIHLFKATIKLNGKRVESKKINIKNEIGSSCDCGDGWRPSDKFLAALCQLLQNKAERQFLLKYLR